MAWQTPKTNWTANDGADSGDFNRIESNIAFIADNPSGNVLELAPDGGTIIGAGGVNDAAYGMVIGNHLKIEKSADPKLTLRDIGIFVWDIGMVSSKLAFFNTNGEAGRIDPVTLNWLFGTISNPGERVHIDGSMRVTGTTHPFIVKSTGFLDDTWIDGTLNLSNTVEWKYYHKIASTTRDALFTTLSSWVPNVGDTMVVTGQAFSDVAGTIPFRCLYIKRVNSTRIDLSGLKMTSGQGIDSVSGVVGDFTVITDVEVMSNFDAIP